MLLQPSTIHATQANKHLKTYLKASLVVGRLRPERQLVGGADVQRPKAVDAFASGAGASGERRHAQGVAHTGCKGVAAELWYGVCQQRSNSKANMIGMQ